MQIVSSRSASPRGRPAAIVLGAGIQGVAAALALDRAGWHVDLIDRAPAPLLGTSRSSEGKLHLGYVYGNEPGRATAGLMVEGAVSFAELLDQWLPQPLDWAALRSEQFTYAILADSMVSTEQLGEHYRWVDDAVTERFDHGASYAGARFFSRAQQLPTPGSGGFSGDVVAAYRTCEIAVDPERLRAHLIAGLHARGINCLSRSVIQGVERAPHGFKVTATNGDGTVMTRCADAVINCLWEGRLAVDATMGVPSPRSCFYRLKYAVNATMDPRRAKRLTTTFVLGPFGDVVCRGDGRVYLSWYPVCLAGTSADLEPPASWRPALDNPDTTEAGRDIAAATVAALATRIEALRGVRIDSVTAGVVVAWGESDIDQPDSELHQRHAIGVHDHDGYISVDTGKLTTAPLFAARVAEVLGSHGRRPG